jgi:hypothetical protein
MSPEKAQAPLPGGVGTGGRRERGRASPDGRPPL